MSALTSLLVRDRVVPVSKIEEALQSQVFLGGDIEIILLEMNVVAEDVLSAYRAALFDLLPATREEVMKASREALRRVPRDLARSLGIVPIHYDAGTLVVAAWEPLYESRRREVEAQLECELSVRIVNQARLAAGLAHHYAFELDPRLRRLSEALRRRDPGVVPFVRPPTPASRPFGMGRGSDSDDQAAGDSEEEIGTSLAPPSALAEAYSEVEAEVVGSEPGSEIAAADPIAAAPAEEFASVGSEFGAAEAVVPEEPLPPGVSAQLAELATSPFDSTQALELLGEARQRDDVLYIMVSYARQFFDFVALFSVAKEGARARMTNGAGIAHDEAQHALIPPSKSGMFAQVITGKQPVSGLFGAVAEERQAAALLRRSGEWPGLLVPVVLNGRAILTLYLERTAQPVAVEDAALIEAIVPGAVEALRRVILENKRRASSLPPPLHKPAPSPAAAVDENRPPDVSTGFSAVDLDTFERLARNEAGWEALSRPLGKNALSGQETRDGAPARERLPGVPRAAPPPPTYEVPAAAPRVSNAYRARVASAAGGEQPLARAEVELPNADATRVPEPARAAPVPDHAKARTRLSLVEANSDVPSVIIDMGESVDTLIELLLQAPPGSEPAQVAELLHIGESVLPVLMQRFPGPLWFDRSKPFKRRPRGRDVSAVASAIVAFGDPAAPYLASLIGSSDPDRCYYALMVAGEIAHNDLIDPVARRVLDRDDSVRLLALEVLRGYAALPQYDVVMRAIAELSERPGKDPRRQRLAVEALGELRDQRALRTLIARLSDRDEQVAQAAHRALVILTGQDFGLSPRKWEGWAEGWARAHRVEWLIESLLHADEGVRTLAGEELKQLTQQYFGYHPALPRRDRELAQRKYREWWELEGRLAMFASGMAR